MRDRRYVSDAGYHQSGALKRTYSRFPPGAGALDQNVDLAESLVHALSRRLLRSPLSREGSAFP